MVLPTGHIGLDQVNVELGRVSNHAITLDESDVRSIAGIMSG